MKQLFWLFILIALCGCKAEPNNKFAAGSSPASTENPSPVSKPATLPASPSASVADNRPVIVCFGDSLTAGLGTDPGQSYPDYLQTLLNGEGYRYRVVNEGVSGDTTKDGVARVAHVLSLKPAIVVVEFGGNDGLRGLPLTETQKNLAGMVTTIHASGAKVLLAGISLPPSYGQDYITRFNAMYPAIAKQAGVSLNPFIYKDVYNTPGDIQDDGIHATAKGNQQVAKNIAASLKPLLKR
ncbi:MAG TPA: arylesterase [Acidobacteriaceae bacterium]